MDFYKYISTPKNTSADEPLTTTIKLARGKLTGGFVYFPSGPAGLLHFTARVGIHQILPFNTGESYRLDDALATFNLSITLAEPPFLIDCVTWNESTLYDHVLSVCFFLEPINRKIISIDALKDIFAQTIGYQKS